MQVVSFPARQTRTHYRHELRTLTYVTLDEANGGIIRNLNHEGVAVQAVAPLRPEQRVRVRFELRFPRLRVEAHGQVSWSSASGQCGIRFVDLPARTSHQIDEWIFSTLLDAASHDAFTPYSILGEPINSIVPEENAACEDDGLRVSASSRPAIRLKPESTKRYEAPVLREEREEVLGATSDGAESQLDWLYRPLSPRTLAWLVDSLVLAAALLLFAFIFLSITHELPPWPLTLGAGSAAAVFVAATYWGLFAMFGGPSLGGRIAQASSGMEEEDEREGAGRFR